MMIQTNRNWKEEVEKLYLSIYFISVEEVIPSIWDGNYTCKDHNILRQFELNFTQASTDITVSGNMRIGSIDMGIQGTFATAFKMLAIQSIDLVLHDIFDRNFTNVEINAVYESAVFMTGKIILLDDVLDKVVCPVELRRRAGKTDFVNDSYFIQQHALNDVLSLSSVGFSYFGLSGGIEPKLRL